MLQLVVEEEGRDWKLLLPYVLFTIQESPQASTGFTPFELLFSRRPRNLFNITREAWEEVPLPIIKYVQDMQAQIDKVIPIIREHLQVAQAEQYYTYNCPAQPTEFNPGNPMLLLLPSARCK